MPESDAVRRLARVRYWREAEARVVVEAWRESGEELAEFCRRHRMRRGRVARWVGRLDEGGDVQFHPVRLVRPPGGSTDGPIELELRGGEIVRLPRGFAAEDLRQILTALGERQGC